MSAIRSTHTAIFAAISAKAAAENMITAEAIATEMQSTVREHVRMLLTESLQRAWETAARIYGLTVRRVRAYYNGEVRTVPAHEYERIRRARIAVAQERLNRINAERESLSAALQELGG